MSGNQSAGGIEQAHRSGAGGGVRPARRVLVPGMVLALLSLIVLGLSACGEDGDAEGRPPAGPVKSSPDFSSSRPGTPVPPIFLPAGGGAAMPPADRDAATEIGEDAENWDDSGVMTGTWEGSWSFYGRGAEGAAKITLRHYDQSFNGTIELTPDQGAICGGTSATSGTIVWGLQFDDFVSFGFYDIYSYGFTFHGTLEGNTLRGEFNAINDCGSESGRFVLTL